jgi:predicted ribosomally synthesized peptide with nif11-like leader
MSTEQAERFIAAVQEDSALRAEIEAAGTDDRGQGFVAVAHAHGFDFTIEEFRQQVTAAEAELAGRQLDGVAGGSGELDGLLLQVQLQKRQHAVQMLSNISASLHDTSQTIIRNLR